jgi:predicted metal-dependent peptidase
LLARQKAPYFRSVLLGLAPVEVPGLGTIGVTEHGVLLIDWEFIRRVTPEEMAGLLVHEVMHVCLEHCKRSRRAARDPALSNKADDLSINPAITDMGLKLPDGPLRGQWPEDYGFKRGLSADEYYELLRQQREAKKQAQKKQKQGGRNGQGEGGQGGEGEPDEPNNEEGEDGQGGDDDHDHPGGGGEGDGEASDKPHAGGGWCGSCANRPMPGEPDEKAKASRPKGEIDRMIRQAAEAVREHGAKSRGTVPAFLQRWADDMLAPPEIPWQTELGVITRHACGWRDGAVQHRYDAPSRRQAGIGFGAGRPVLPRLRMPVPNVTVIIDTSGSMSPRELGEAARETNGILKAVGAEVTICTCDASVTGVTKARTVQEAVARLKGGGGTDMRPAFTAVMKERPRPDVIICVTDGHVGDGFPQQPIPGVKVIIVLVGHGAPAIANTEWAKTVRTDSAKAGHKIEDEDAA